MARLFFGIAAWLLALSATAAPLRIAVSESIFSLPFYVAKHQSYFRTRGVEVEFVECAGGGRCVSLMLKGKADLSTSTELPVVFNSFTRQDLGIVATFASASNHIKLLARVDSRVISPADLVNKKVAYVKGGVGHYAMDLALVYSGVDPKRVSMVAMKAEDAQQALIQGKVDAASVWEPFASRIVLAMGDDVVYVPTPKLHTETFNLVATRHAIQKRAADIEAVLLALNDAAEFIQANPKQSKALAARYLNLPPELVSQFFSGYRYRLGLNRSLLRTMEGQARWALMEGHVPAELQPPRYSELLYPELLRAVLPDTVLLY